MSGLQSAGMRVRRHLRIIDVWRDEPTEIDAAIDRGIDSGIEGNIDVASS
jgi:hypothetical protein